MKTEYTSLSYVLASRQNKIKIKGKCRPVSCQAGTWEGSGTAEPILDAGARRVKVGSSTPRPLFPRKMHPLPILEGTQCAPCLILTGPQNLAHHRSSIRGPPSSVTIPAELFGLPLGLLKRQLGQAVCSLSFKPSRYLTICLLVLAGGI